MDDIQGTLKQRGERYGDFADQARITERLQETLRAEAGWEQLTDVQKQALSVIASKMARMVSGDPRYLDSVRDIIGYATLMFERMDIDGATDTQTTQVSKIYGEWQ